MILFTYARFYVVCSSGVNCGSAAAAAGGGGGCNGGGVVVAGGLMLMVEMAMVLY